MGNQAFLGTVSQPVSAIHYINNNSADYKRQLALQKATDTVQGIHESVEAYQKRMAEFREKLNQERIKANTEEAERRFRAIQMQNPFNTTDLRKLEYALSDYQSLFLFNQFNKLDKSFGEKLYTAQKQLTAVNERKQKLENGENPQNSNGPSSAGADYQAPGYRDILS